jgi:hypothetical protein
MNTKEAVITIIDIVDKIKKTDDEIINITNKLKIILLNLQIEEARIKENTGIEPIIKELDKSIKKINESIKVLVYDNRITMTEATNELLKYIAE